jgi:hypothetical protein
VASILFLCVVTGVIMDKKTITQMIMRYVQVALLQDLLYGNDAQIEDKSYQYGVSPLETAFKFHVRDELIKQKTANG